MLLTVRQAADKIGVTHQTLRYAIHRGKLHRHEQYGRVLVDSAEIELFQRTRRKASQAPQSVVEADHSPHQFSTWQELLKSFDETDEDEQRRTFEALKAAIDKDRPGQRSIFGEDFNPPMQPGE